jgi:hypothetical protein
LGGIVGAVREREVAPKVCEISIFLEESTKAMTKLINEVAKKTKTEKKIAFYLLRFCLTGKEKGMEVPLVLSLLDPEEISIRVHAGFSILSS